MRRIMHHAALAALVAAAPFICLAEDHAQTIVTEHTRVRLVDPRKQSSLALSDPATFAWRLFVFVNWPELPGHRGLPNMKGRIGEPSPTVWESFKNVSEVYKPNGQRPPAFQIDDELPPIPGRRVHPTKEQLAEFGPVDSKWVHFLSEQVMIDGQQVCDSESNVIQYDVRGNLSYFNYVVNNPSGYQLYNIEGQQAALADQNFLFNFPVDTLEVKASWRVLEPGQDASRYWTAIGVYWDNKHVLHTARIGLTGLHINSKAMPDWVWTTFEQVDNPTATYKYFLGQKGAALGPNPNYDSKLTPINQQWQSALAGTKWQYYALMDVQTQFETPMKQPTLMSNTQMETYFQGSSSCISCHKLASIGLPQNPSQNLRLKLFYPLNPYVGDVDFQGVANQQFPGEQFKEMDFLWSLRNAQSKKRPNPQASESALIKNGDRL